MFVACLWNGAKVPAGFVSGCVMCAGARYVHTHTCMHTPKSRSVREQVSRYSLGVLGQNPLPSISQRRCLRGSSRLTLEMRTGPWASLACQGWLLEAGRGAPSLRQLRAGLGCDLPAPERVLSSLMSASGSVDEESFMHRPEGGARV